MAIGNIIHHNFTEIIDPYTGVHLRRLTEPDHVSHHMYFYNRMTTKNGKKLLCCEEREEGRQLYLLDLESGDSLQLTAGEALDDYGAMIGADDQYIFYRQGNRLWKQSLDTMERECVYSIPEGWSGGNWDMSEDNRYLTIVETKKGTLPVRDKTESWDFFAETCRAKPHCRIIYGDIITGKFHTVVEDYCWFGHAQLRPGDPDTILFCHEGPYDLIDARLWLVQSDGSRYRCCREQPSDLILTHEFWLPDGSKMAYVYRETRGEKIENIRFFDPDAMTEEIFMPCSPYAHFICDRRNQYMVGDAQGSDTPIHLLGKQEQATEKEGIKNDFIYLISVKERQEYKLCYHGSSWKASYGNPQDSHPHPCFSEDNQRVIFVSDREGMPCIYLVDLASNGIV